MSIDREQTLSINRKGWDEVAAKFYGSTALPQYGPLAKTEEELNLIDNLKHNAVLELGCGSGHSLYYLWKHKEAHELWGLDFSPQQLEFAQGFLQQHDVSAKLFLASMDANPGLPEDYFDCVISIYALGWTPDLTNTLGLVHSYLKPGGIFVFSWEHPVYQCLSYSEEIQEYIFTSSYLAEGSELIPSWRGVEIVTHRRKLSTYVNGIIEAGLVLERLVESELNVEIAREKDYAPEEWYSVPRAQLLPTTFIIKARKPK